MPRYIFNTTDNSKQTFAGVSSNLWKVFEAFDEQDVGLSVKVSVYSEEKRTKDKAVILYIVNHSMPKVGTEEDLEIVKDLLSEGYVVVVLDYLNNPLAVSPEIEHSIQAVRKQLPEILEAIGEVDVTRRSYVLPSGYRIARNIEYFDIRKHAYIGALQEAVDQWNTQYFKERCGDRIPGGWFEAKDYSELIGPSGEPLCWTLMMDIIYPSKPKSKVPVLIRASSVQCRNNNDNEEGRPYKIAAVMRGMAFVIYDHEYFPMCRADEGYNYLYNSGADGRGRFRYGYAAFIGVLTHTAAIRCVRYYADDFGYSKEKIGVYGMSKSGYCSLLTNQNPTALPEKELFDNKEVGADKSPRAYGQQPFLTYRDGSPISCTVTVAYTGMGDGLNRCEVIADKNSNPHLLVCGVDEYNSWTNWHKQLKYFNSLNIPVMEISMPERTGRSRTPNAGHVLAMGIDPIYKYDRFSAAMDFLEYYLKDTDPKHIYTYPADGTEYNETDGIFIQFIAPIKGKSVAENIEIYSTEKNIKIDGQWKSMYGGTRWCFFPKDTLKGEYKVIISESLEDIKGKKLKKQIVTSFIA